MAWDGKKIHFVRKGCDRPIDASKPQFFPQFLTSNVHFVRKLRHLKVAIFFSIFDVEKRVAGNASKSQFLL